MRRAVIADPPVAGAGQEIRTDVPTFTVVGCEGTGGAVAAIADKTGEKVLHPKAFLTLYRNWYVEPAESPVVTWEVARLSIGLPVKGVKEVPPEPESHSRL